MARAEDVTERLVREAAYGPGDRPKRVRETKGAVKLSPSLQTFYDSWKAPSDKTIGFISNALAYSRSVERGSASNHKNMLRLIKGGHIRVCEVGATPPLGSNAAKDTPQSGRFYVLRAGACPGEIDPQAAMFSGGRRHRR